MPGVRVPHRAQSMRILGIETSCDETALSIVDAKGGLHDPEFSLVGSVLMSQVDLHKEHGGVVPMLAKREHAKNIIPLLKKLLKENDLEKIKEKSILPVEIGKILEREHDLLKEFSEYLQTIEKPEIDAIAVTYGPGLEPALWVGISFAKALGLVWDIPVIPTNHMEGHIISPLLKPEHKSVVFPAIALLISGGHTEIVLAKGWGDYEIVGVTRDDAVGEAFDKVARLLDLPYPGGPQISKLAHEARTNKYPHHYSLPRPMIKSDDYAFSFSGLKTSVLYTLKKDPATTQELRCDLAREFEDSVTEVLLKKTEKALITHNAYSLIIGGGVIANGHIRNAFISLTQQYQDISLFLPETSLSTDNATMIAMAGYIARNKAKMGTDFRAEGNASYAMILNNER